MARVGTAVQSPARTTSPGWPGMPQDRWDAVKSQRWSRAWCRSGPPRTLHSGGSLLTLEVGCDAGDGDGKTVRRDRTT